MHCFICGVKMESVSDDEIIRKKDACGKEHIIMSFCPVHASMLLQNPMTIN